MTNRGARAVNEYGLLPCPFCGPGQSMVDPWFDDVSKRWAVGCGRCGASSGRSVHAEGSKAAAIKSWNTRASAPHVLPGPSETLSQPPQAGAAPVAWSNIELVFQQDAGGCIIACLAMVTGETYSSIKNEFADFEERGSLNFRHVDDFLHRHGFAWQTIFEYLPPGNSRREVWPPSPWASLHMAEVVMSSGNYHSVVMLADGSVLDPLTTQRKRLVDYKEVGSVRAIYRISSDAAPPAAPLVRELAEWKQAAHVEAGLRREFLTRAEKAEEALEQTRKALLALKTAVEASKQMNGREYIDLGIQVNNALDRAAAALSSPHTESAKEWQPIETAPRDDRRILVWRPDEKDGHHFAHAGVDYWRLNGWYLSRRYQQPTHWMPLPAPPADSTESK